MIQEELTKLLMESYERGQSDMIKACHETISIAIDTAILVEREACAKMCEEMRTYVGRNNAVTQSSAQDCATAIRARGQA
jgi:hypothetical protein